ncbi:FixH family protein [Polaromonas sp.]|uniref:FixH family protein n=1 Tax=Polaromonas sp. TaxID=1869339 RepID=UPI0032667F5D
MNPMLQTPPVVTPPWWKHGHVWLLIAGPAAVVVAGFATAWIAVSYPDPVVAEDYYRRGVEINKTLAAQDKALMPAVQGRNHAATPPAIGAR